MALVVTSADKMTTTGYTPLVADNATGSEPSVTANGNPVLVAGATWATQAPNGGGPSINAAMLTGSAKVTAGGVPVLLSTGPVTPPAAVLTVVPPRTVEAT